MRNRAPIPFAVMQNADSFFPSGAVSFSWGLETLHNTGRVTTRDELFAVLRAQIEGRWATQDRPLMIQAALADDDFGRIMELDALTEAQSLCSELRQGSVRSGNALLRIHKSLNTPGAAQFGEQIESGTAFGHLPVVQGYLWHRLGITPQDIQTMALHGLCTSILGAAVRLSVVGYLDAQHIYQDMIPILEGVLNGPQISADQAHSFVPQIDIASMNHETDDMRLFVN